MDAPAAYWRVVGSIKSPWRKSSMRVTRYMLVAMAIATAIGASHEANAQCSGNAGTCNTTNTASVTVGALVKLGMSSTTTTLTSPTADDVDAGTVIPDPGPSFTIKANRSWTLKIKALTTNPAFWNYVGDQSGAKPIGDLAWSTSSGGTFAAITSTDAAFTSSPTSTNSTTAHAFFRTSWAGGFESLANAPGSYSLPIVFTLTAP